MSVQAESFAFLKRIVDTPGPSGYEEQVQRVFREQVTPYAEQVYTDIMGNVIAVRNPRTMPRVMLTAHADEIGFLVRYISEDGNLYFGAIGGHDAVVSVGQRVSIHTQQGPILGVLGRKALHLMESSERDQVPKLEDLWIDIGAKSREEAAKIVQIGDSITFAQELKTLLEDRVTGRSLDNKVGCFLVAETMRLLATKQLRCGLFAVTTVQEEIGMRGVRAASFAVDAQVGLATDVGHAMDFPGADKKRHGDTKVGGGPVITRGPNVNPRVYELLVQTAKELNLPHQIVAQPNGTATDANLMQINRTGMAVGLVSIPLRYMHTPNEIVSLSDLENAAKLMAGFVERITSELAWTPH